MQNWPEGDDYMCGITGMFDLYEKKPIDIDLLRRANDLIHHRGPDDHGVFANNGIGLAMRRLSIIDIAHGHQPIFNENSDICIVFNGEIYNHLDLREFLVKKGHDFRTYSDTETIVHGYEEWGIEGCLSRLRGMFAFALWDKVRDTLFLCRDRMGIKPLYFSRHGDRLYFSSEMRGDICRVRDDSDDRSRVGRCVFDRGVRAKPVYDLQGGEQTPACALHDRE